MRADRTSASFIATLLLACATTAVCAGPAAASSGADDGDPLDAVAMFKRICLKPSSEWIGLGEAEAKLHDWNLDPLQSGRKYGLVASNDVKETEPPLWNARGWRVGEEHFARLLTQVVSSDWPMLKADSCVVAIPGQYLREFLSLVGGATGLDPKAVKVSGPIAMWELEHSTEGAKVIARYISVSQQPFKWGFVSFIGYMDYELPKDQTGLPHQGIGP